MDINFCVWNQVDVNGEKAAPIYKFLKTNKGGILGDGIKWNFAKFLIDKDGNVVDRYAPTTSPLSFEVKTCLCPLTHQFILRTPFRVFIRKIKDLICFFLLCRRTSRNCWGLPECWVLIALSSFCNAAHFCVGSCIIKHYDEAYASHLPLEKCFSSVKFGFLELCTVLALCLCNFPAYGTYQKKNSPAYVMLFHSG